MKKTFSYYAKCDQCDWESGYSVKTYIDEEVKRHRLKNCQGGCSHSNGDLIMKFANGKQICAACNQIIREHY